MLKRPVEHLMKDYGKEYLMYHKHYQHLKQRYRINIDDYIQELNTQSGVRNNKLKDN
jgi:hypothetical protein